MARAILVLILNKEAANGGKMEPPTMDMMISEEANLEPSPKFLHERAKMVGNIMDWKKYTIMIATTAIIPPPSMAMIKDNTAPTA